MLWLPYLPLPTPCAALHTLNMAVLVTVWENCTGMKLVRRKCWADSPAQPSQRPLGRIGTAGEEGVRREESREQVE